MQGVMIVIESAGGKLGWFQALATLSIMSVICLDRAVKIKKIGCML